MLLPLVAVIVFTRRVPQADARSHRAQCRQVDRTRHGEDVVRRPTTSRGRPVIAADRYWSDLRSTGSTLSPVLVMLGAAMVLLVVGALAPRWPRHLYALVHRCCRTGGDDPVLLPLGRHHRRWRIHPHRRGAAVRRVLDVRHHHHCVRCGPGCVRHRRLPPSRGPRRSRGVCPLPVGRDRWRDDGLGQRSDRAVPRARRSCRSRST